MIMRGKMPKAAIGIFAIMILAVAAFSYVAITMAFSSTSPPSDRALQTELGPGNYVWQSLYITNMDGTHYWANAKQPFSLAQLFGSSSGKASDFTQVQTVQNNIYMNLNDSNAISWIFSCVETITLTDQSGSTISTVTSQTVNANGQSVSSGVNTWITGASFSASDFQTILNQPSGTYHFVITLSSISLQLTDSNGSTQNLSASNGSSQNVLTWLIEVQ